MRMQLLMSLRGLTTLKRDGELRGSESESHGTLVALLVSALTSSTGSVSFQVHLDWVCEFDSPDLTPMGPGNSIQAADGYTGYFTTSVSDWANGTKLSVKATSGGNLVPFTGIETGVVYQIDPRAKLPYFYGGNINKGEIKYGCRIQSYSTVADAMAVFADLDKAKEYCKTGDTNNCLAYSQAGSAITPSNPPWYPIWRRDTKVLGEEESSNAVRSASHKLGFAFVTGHKQRAYRPSVLPTLTETIDPQQGDWYLA